MDSWLLKIFDTAPSTLLLINTGTLIWLVYLYWTLLTEVRKHDLVNLKSEVTDQHMGAEMMEIHDGFKRIEQSLSAVHRRLDEKDKEFTVAIAEMRLRLAALEIGKKATR